MVLPSNDHNYGYVQCTPLPSNDIVVACVISFGVKSGSDPKFLKEGDPEAIIYKILEREGPKSLKMAFECSFQSFFFINLLHSKYSTKGGGRGGGGGWRLMVFLKADLVCTICWLWLVWTFMSGLKWGINCGSNPTTATTFCVVKIIIYYIALNQYMCPQVCPNLVGHY